LPEQRVSCAGRVLVNFSSNDYLGLAESAALGPTGSGASALVTGYRPSHEALEAGLARFLGYEAVLLTSSGYLANLAVTTALAGRGDTVVQDRLCHASLIDAARLSGARLLRYRHGDAEAAGARLAQGEGHCLLISDGVFSMDGDEAPVAALAAVADRHDATLVIDDAHGIGVLGARGAGLCELTGADATQVPVLVGTLGKAFGCAGAFIAGSRAFVEHLVNEARSIIYSTALAPTLAMAGQQALARIQAEPERRAKLHENIQHFRAGAQSRGLPLLPSRTPIQPLVLGSEARALALSAALDQCGFLVSAIRPPTVPAGSSRLRFTLSAAHSPAQIDGVLDATAEALPAGAAPEPL
jgi:8-amino-7-oxononanoate synthase